MELTGRALGKDINQHQLLRASLTTVNELGYSTALWRNPESSTKHQLVDLSGSVNITDARLEEMRPGFLFTRFNGTDRYHIHEDIHLRLDEGGSSFTPNTKEYSTEDFFNKLQGHLISRSSPDYYVNEEIEPVSTSHEHFIQYIHNGMKHIEAGDFLKVVPARSRVIELKQEFDLAKLFLDLCDRYPNAFISLVSIPGIGTWVGASPESLISVDAEGTFSTVSLAGTQPYDPNKELYDMPWTQKEIEEQAMVTRYVIDCFKKIRLREFEEHGPKTVKAGNLCHLKTDFIVNTIETNFKDLGSVMLELLHPTSAVCGMPMQPARDFILENEGFDREFFSGHLGPVNIDQEIRLYVNLRCSQLLDQKAILYAGAGVTAYSVPENEWKETELKYKTMENLF